MKTNSGGDDTLKDNHQKNPLKAIRKKCLDCCGFKYSEVKECHITNCPLWPYRMGNNPFRERRMTDKQKQEAALRLPREK